MAFSVTELAIVCGCQHSTRCVRILRRNIDQLGISRNFSILDSTDQLSVVKNVMKDENIDTKRFEPRAVLNAISSAKRMYSGTIMQVKSMKIILTKTIARVYKGYEKDYAAIKASILMT